MFDTILKPALVAQWTRAPGSGPGCRRFESFRGRSAKPVVSTGFFHRDGYLSSNGSFRKPKEFEFQPDLAFYIGEDVRSPPRSTSPVNLNENEPPTLVVEIASTSLSDDLGRKRLLYEQVGVREYWTIDVKASQAIAFEIFERGGSGCIQVSQVLPDLKKFNEAIGLTRGDREPSIAACHRLDIKTRETRTKIAQSASEIVIASLSNAIRSTEVDQSK